jgi:hypothetical protein
MDIWLANSHFDFSSDPAKAYGSRLTSDNLLAGVTIWDQEYRNEDISNDRIMLVRKYQRSAREADYLKAITALSTIACHGGIAVIAMRRMQDYPQRLITTPNTWLVAYKQGKQKFSLPENLQKPTSCGSFLDTRTGDDWAAYFTELLK